MRRTLRLFAAVKPVRYFEAGNPTGLTGLYTHSTPRSSLLALYSVTLDKLNKFPESSLYRQSVEALTKHRMSIVAAVEPPGHKEWSERASKILEENPSAFEFAGPDNSTGKGHIFTIGGRTFVSRSDPQPRDERNTEWDGERDVGPTREGLRGEEEKNAEMEALFNTPDPMAKKVKWEPEPQMTADQVEEVQNKIGAGLIEEVIQMAESELKLLDVMYDSKVWENLEEQPPAGQWEYFEREKP
ncbi:ETC complex I subunit conserved region-domain-containing protein [Xylariaceae sp. FL0016]|nr:ETC complex I subunit conserved region-domain-containing protein [Xylariaceae sp. FL0016]